MTAQQIRESIATLEEQKAKTTTPIIAQNCERTILIFTKLLNGLNSPNRQDVREVDGDLRINFGEVAKKD
ncbi:hypothetical protein MUK70_11605 [Dyadobacter chenwenxiniae]|uniref:Uncharacterized protein n=1 Tax=Dyadobacter chenwenxiniae TaxID=2906456 RepID=A0A9X1PGP2_9BACT|nr:hypothetical protein [Dyadobacter chenwenxiniae]MCF0059885.1 hypothetical protein [Dyadobacter chenwenxiniae]UON85625.1 hypothetical protein MUK70_11605 [Dyadobacter chenwenxiniae]